MIIDDDLEQTIVWIFVKLPALFAITLVLIAQLTVFLEWYIS